MFNMLDQSFNEITQEKFFIHLVGEYVLFSLVAINRKSHMNIFIITLVSPDYIMYIKFGIFKQDFVSYAMSFSHIEKSYLARVISEEEIGNII